MDHVVFVLLFFLSCLFYNLASKLTKHGIYNVKIAKIRYFRVGSWSVKIGDRVQGSSVRVISQPDRLSR